MNDEKVKPRSARIWAFEKPRCHHEEMEPISNFNTAIAEGQGGGQ